EPFCPIRMRPNCGGRICTSTPIPGPSFPQMRSLWTARTSIPALASNFLYLRPNAFRDLAKHDVTSVECCVDLRVRRIYRNSREREEHLRIAVVGQAHLLGAGDGYLELRRPRILLVVGHIPHSLFLSDKHHQGENHHRCDGDGGQDAIKPL